VVSYKIERRLHEKAQSACRRLRRSWDFGDAFVVCRYEMV
jgi:hypothetical protein